MEFAAGVGDCGAFQPRVRMFQRDARAGDSPAAGIVNHSGQSALRALTKRGAGRQQEPNTKKQAMKERAAHGSM